ncbi:hypothetical protein CEXT_179561 [Caerostris extrusa]|uniref:Uncharacterized protein n=1 Tax=Caerostris extrusa TaxID=172846 RepID=A0AAV4PDD8_CAEEX|nr:hypothetical protein CEXT_179561 [Caerostris extrusa]
MLPRSPGFSKPPKENKNGGKGSVQESRFRFHCVPECQNRRFSFQMFDHHAQLRSQVRPDIRNESFLLSLTAQAWVQKDSAATLNPLNIMLGHPQGGCSTNPSDPPTPQLGSNPAVEIRDGVFAQDRVILFELDGNSNSEKNGKEKQRGLLE